ncbi:MAG: chorismate mutase, partial [Shewanella sp.]
SLLQQESSQAALSAFERRVKQLKETGFQAVILDGCQQLASAEAIIPKLRQTLHQYDLLCVIAIEQATDMPLATEHADMLFLTGKQMFNQTLLAQAGTLPIPLFLERNDMASYEEFMAATETILSQGNQQLILCDSGIRTYNNANLPTLDLASLILIKANSHLPIVINPCYAINEDALVLQTQGIKQLKADGIVLNYALEEDTIALMGEVVRELYR